MDYIYDDGGRRAAGYVGSAGDCVTRAIAIASGLPYADVYRAIADGCGSERKGKGKRHGRTARNGVFTSRTWFKAYMVSLGFEWHPTMGIGTGCRVHLYDGELPDGRLIVSVSRHYTAVIDQVIRDTHNPQRETHSFICPSGSTDAPDTIRTVQRRCVYGYWVLV